MSTYMFSPFVANSIDVCPTGVIISFCVEFIKDCTFHVILDGVNIILA